MPMLGLSTTVFRLVSKKNTFLPFHEQFLTFFEIGLHFLEVGPLEVSANLRLNLHWSSLAAFLFLFCSRKFSSLVSFIGSSAEVSLARLI